MEYSSFKTEDPFPGDEDGFFSNTPVHSSCAHIYKYDVVTYREKGPGLSYGEKVDLLKNVFVPEEKKNFFRNNNIF